MTSTTTFGGLNGEGRNSSKVLKPPGGGSSDIFGPSSGVEDTPTRRVRNHNASKLFLDDGLGNNATPARGTGKDTHSRLFGPPPATSPPPPVARSNVLNNGQQATPMAVVTNGNEVLASETDGGDSVVDEPIQTNGNAMPPVVTNGNGNAAPRARVPPGGFSSGLW